MKIRKITFVFSFVLLQIFLTAGSSLAHHSGSHAVTLHTNNRWKECAIVLDPSLTQNDFNAFVTEASELLYFRPMAGAKPLGEFNFDISVERRSVKLEDWEPKWNDTFSHPDADHTLVNDDHILVIPGLRGRMGISERTDAELYFTVSPGSNYGFIGAAIKYDLLADPSSKWGAAIRGSYTQLLGVDDMGLHQVAADVIVSRDIWYFRPYAGATLALSHAVETTDKVHLSNVTRLSPMAMIGSQFVWKYLSIGVEQSFGRLPVTALTVGATF